MGGYFGAVGFNFIQTKEQIENLNKDVVRTPDSRYILNKNDNNIYIEYYKEYAENMGISIKGEMNEDEKIVVNSLRPYLFTNNKLTVSKIDIEKIDNDYYGDCEEKETGIEFSFYMQNALDYIDNTYNYELKDNFQSYYKSNRVNVVGLSDYGSIILPIEKDDNYNNLRKKEETNRKVLINKAKDGDTDAQERLIIYAEQMNKIINKRLETEDFLSVVDTYLLPSQEKSHYDILGEIVNITKNTNKLTKEKIYIFSLRLTGIELEVSINEKDLVGYPTIGMRFMGQCWLQGKILY